MELFICPICRSDLYRVDRALSCATGHSFDLARSGYVNLFPAHQRQSRNPGDSSGMVKARRRFLDRGCYQPLRDELCRIIATGPNAQNTTVLDLGCGEGYFTGGYATVAAAVYGIDVSKPAIQAAAVKYPSLNLAVASTARLPLRTGSFDVVTAILAPFPPATAFDLLARDGFLVRVTPGGSHLRELKDLMYAEPRDHVRASNQILGAGHLLEQEVMFSMQLDQAALLDLISMTPMLHRTKREQIQRIEVIDGMTVSGAFWIDTFTKE